MCSLAPDCGRPGWTIRNDQTAFGAAAAAAFTVNSVQECQNYCVSTVGCVGVDLDVNLRPMRCWPHTEPGAYLQSNIYGQPGTTSYQLLTRCSQTAAQTTATPTG